MSRPTPARAGAGLDDPLADHRVAAHVRPLVLVERTALLQDVARHGDLADVVQLGGGRDALHLVVVEPEAAGDCGGQDGDVGTVGGELGVPLVERAPEHARRLQAGGDAAAVLLGVEPPVGGPQAAAASAASSGSSARPAEHPTSKPVAALGERGARPPHEVVRARRPGRRARARRTRRRPCDRRRRGPPRPPPAGRRAGAGARRPPGARRRRCSS
jgi:hypothetical protein